MPLEALATLTTQEPNGIRRWEYAIQPDVLCLRSVSRWETVETSIPLRAFTGEEIRRTFRQPFSPWSELATGTFACGCVLIACWLVIEVSGQLLGIWERVLFGVFGFGLVLCAGLIVGVRYLRHDWREWRCVEFRHSRGEESETVGVLSDEVGYAEQDRFVEMLRAQIRRCRTGEGP